MSKPQALSIYKAFRKELGRFVREGQVHIDRAIQPSSLPRVMFFASQADSGGSGYLRARGVGLALRSMGWRTLMPNSGLTLSQRQRLIALEKPDVIVLQQARHPLNRPSFYPGVPCIFDLDDADILDPRCANDVVECARESKAVVAGSRYVAELLRPYNDNIAVIWTCVDRDISHPVRASESRDPIIAWASLSPSGFTNEAKLIQDAMVELAKKAKFTFRLYGTSDPWGTRPADWAHRYAEPIRNAGAEVELTPLLDYDSFLQSLESVAIGLQPVCIESDHSRGRSFGKVLGYLTSGAAVIASNTVDHPLFFKNGTNGLLVENDSAQWAEACASLLANPFLRAQLAVAGRTDLGRRLVSRKAAELLDPILRHVISATSSSQ